MKVIAFYDVRVNCDTVAMANRMTRLIRSILLKEGINVASVDCEGWDQILKEQKGGKNG